MLLLNLKWRVPPVAENRTFALLLCRQKNSDRTVRSFYAQILVHDRSGGLAVFGSSNWKSFRRAGAPASPGSARCATTAAPGHLSKPRRCRRRCRRRCTCCESGGNFIRGPSSASGGMNILSTSVPTCYLKINRALLSGAAADACCSGTAARKSAATVD